MFWFSELCSFKLVQVGWGVVGWAFVSFFNCAQCKAGISVKKLKLQENEERKEEKHIESLLKGA